MLVPLSFTKFLGLAWLTGLGDFMFGVFSSRCFFYTPIFKLNLEASSLLWNCQRTAKGYITLLKLEVGFLSL